MAHDVGETGGGEGTMKFGGNPAANTLVRGCCVQIDERNGRHGQGNRAGAQRVGRADATRKESVSAFLSGLLDAASARAILRDSNDTAHLNTSRARLALA